jgi:hypothetical protein
MEPREAAQVASIFTRALEEFNDHDALAQGLPAVAGRMEPREAARILTLALEKNTDANARIALAQGLATVVGKLSRAEAATVCHPVVQTLLKAAETENAESERQSLAMAVASLLSASDNLDASGVSAKLAFAVCSGRAVNPSDDRNTHGIDSLDALLTSGSCSEVNRRKVAVAAVVGLVSATPFPALAVLPAVSEPLPCRLSTQDLAELLKMPTCFGEARKVVLKHLGNRYGRTFANHWEFVRFAKEQRLDLDLLSPPKRPKR